jgi:hypothetical protein
VVLLCIQRQKCALNCFSDIPFSWGKIERERDKLIVHLSTKTKASNQKTSGPKEKEEEEKKGETEQREEEKAEKVRLIIGVKIE